MPTKKRKPGTERFRDERRKTGGPRMHGGRWHDHGQKEVAPGPVELEERDAAPEVEASPERTGMGKRAKQQGGRRDQDQGGRSTR